MTRRTLDEQMTEAQDAFAKASDELLTMLDPLMPFALYFVAAALLGIILAFLAVGIVGMLA